MIEKANRLVIRKHKWSLAILVTICSFLLCVLLGVRFNSQPLLLVGFMFPIISLILIWRFNPKFLYENMLFEIYDSGIRINQKTLIKWSDFVDWEFDMEQKRYSTFSFRTIDDSYSFYTLYNDHEYTKEHKIFVNGLYEKLRNNGKMKPNSSSNSKIIGYFILLTAIVLLALFFAKYWDHGSLMKGLPGVLIFVGILITAGARMISKR